MIKLFSPGRTELAGNHTDHQKGRVLAAAVDKGIHAQIELNYDNIVRIKSGGFPDMEINILDLDVHPEEFGSSAALVRGAASAMYDLGASFGGFNAVLHSDLSSGSGLSSSAAFSVLMVRAFNELYNDSQLEAMAIAKAAQQAENLHFGKPCGLMDQRSGQSSVHRLSNGRCAACQRRFLPHGADIVPHGHRRQPRGA